MRGCAPLGTRAGPSASQRQNRRAMPAPPSITREFRRVLAAEGMSNFGAMLSRLAIPWLAALVLDATPLQMAALLLADVAAAAAGALLLGAWVERHGKRAVMLACDALRAVALATLALLAWLGLASMAVLVVCAAANGLVTMAFEVARSAWMAQRLASGEHVRGNAKLAMATSVSATAAFALGGWLFQWLGAAAALVVDALSYLASAACLRGVSEVKAVAERAGEPAAAHGTAGGGVARDLAGHPSGHPSRGPSRGPSRDPSRHEPRQPLRERCRKAWGEVSAGLAGIAERPLWRTLALIHVLMALVSALAATSYMIYVARDLAIPTGQLGLIFAVGGLGAVAGAQLAAWAAERWGLGWAMCGGLVAAAAGTACMALATAGLTAVFLLVVHQLVGDAGVTLYEVHDRTLRQTQAEPARVVRMDAGLRFLGQCATLAGALGGGLLGNVVGARGVLWACVAVAAAAAAVAAARLRGLKQLPSVRPAAGTAAG